MKRALWLLRRYAAAASLWLGLALIAAAAALQWWAIRPLQQKVEALERVGAGSREGHLTNAVRALDQPSGPRAQLTAFYGFFDRGSKLTGLLGTLYAVGVESGLELKRAEYRLTSAPDRRLDRYQVVLPIRGSYRSIRAFIAGALRELPTMSLDQVQFQRKEIGDPIVDAQVTVTFHLVR